MKNQKLLLNIQTKCGDIAYKILNVAIDAERTFKCKWPYYQKHIFTYSFFRFYVVADLAVSVLCCTSVMFLDLNLEPKINQILPATTEKINFCLFKKTAS